MRLTHWTDYSLRVLMYCAQCESQQSVATIQAIADQHDISKSHLTKIVMTLAADGYLLTSRGRGGGIRLGRPASQIVLGEVVRKTETDFQMVECFGEGAQPLRPVACLSFEEGLGRSAGSRRTDARRRRRDRRRRSGPPPPSPPAPRPA